MIEKNLRYYRLVSGLSKKALAEACGVTPMAITNYEAGKRRPDIDVLEKLAVALGVKLSDLLRRRNRGLVFQHGDFRKNSSLNSASQELARESVEEYLGRFYDIVEILGGEVMPNAPECGSLPIDSDIEANAQALRRHLGIPLVGPVYDLVGILENQGILVVALSQESDFSGMNGFVSGRPYVAYNSEMSPERNRSTIAHELAHLMFDWPSNLVGKAQEDLATAISGAFLLPEPDVRRELGLRRRAVTEDMSLVAKEYGVSMMLLAKRASLTGVISASAYKNFCIWASKNGWRKSEPARIAPESPELFEQLVLRAASEGDISIQRAAELLDRAYSNVQLECAPCGA